MESSIRGNRFRRRQQKRSAEKAISGKIFSATKTIDFTPGARYPVKVISPHTDQQRGVQMAEFYALLVVDADGRTHLEALGDQELPRLGEPEFYATVEIEGYSDWQMISNIPVQISRHTRGVVYTKLVMEDLERHGTETML